VRSGKYGSFQTDVGSKEKKLGELEEKERTPSNQRDFIVPVTSSEPRQQSKTVPEKGTGGLRPGFGKIGLKSRPDDEQG